MTFNEMIQSDKPVLVDVDKNPQAASAYQVQGVPTLIVFKKEKLFENRSGMAKSLLEQQGFKHVINGGTWQNVAQFVH